MSDKIYRKVAERDDERCQFPEVGPDGHPTGRKCYQRATGGEHHRILRSQGGSESEDNLICLCMAHHEWCHLHPGQARDLGLIVVNGLDDPRRHEWMERDTLHCDGPGWDVEKRFEELF